MKTMPSTRFPKVPSVLKIEKFSKKYHNFHLRHAHLYRVVLIDYPAIQGVVIKLNCTSANFVSKYMGRQFLVDSNADIIVWSPGGLLSYQYNKSRHSKCEDHLFCYIEHYNSLTINWPIENWLKGCRTRVYIQRNNGTYKKILQFLN